MALPAVTGLGVAVDGAGGAGTAVAAAEDAAEADRDLAVGLSLPRAGTLVG